MCERRRRKTAAGYGLAVQQQCVCVHVVAVQYSSRCFWFVTVVACTCVVGVVAYKSNASFSAEIVIAKLAVFVFQIATAADIWLAAYIHTYNMQIR